MIVFHLEGLCMTTCNHLSADEALVVDIKQLSHNMF